MQKEIRDRKIYFQFQFKIKLHIDDLEPLNYIQTTLGIGKVIWINNTSDTEKGEIAIILAIFSKYNLNTTKHLNFLDILQALFG
jgi:hypothetical protein